MGTILVKIFYGILLFTAGFLVLKFRRKIKSFSGNFAWAETYLGRGTSYLIIILIGCIMMFLGVILPFGGLDFAFEK